MDKLKVSSFDSTSKIQWAGWDPIWRGREENRWWRWTELQCSPLPVSCSVPYGSLLGPLLSLVCLNNIPSACDCNLHWVIFCKAKDFTIKVGDNVKERWNYLLYLVCILEVVSSVGKKIIKKVITKSQPKMFFFLFRISSEVSKHTEVRSTHPKSFQLYKTISTMACWVYTTYIE